MGSLVPLHIKHVGRDVGVLADCGGLDAGVCNMPLKPHTPSRRA